MCLSFGPFIFIFTSSIYPWNRYNDSDRRFQRVLEACGVNKSLTKQGVKEGDTVVVGGVWSSFLVDLHNRTCITFLNDHDDFR